jgi:hypothetical protein
MDKIISCQIKDKRGFKYGETGRCYTYNNNMKSKRKAYYLAVKDEMMAVEKIWKELEGKTEE